MSDAFRPRFSNRLPWQSPVNRLTELRADLLARGVAINDATVSNPTAVGLPPCPPELLAPLGQPAAATYAPEPRGPVATRRAIAEWYSENGARIDPDQLLMTASTSEAYAHLFRLLADPGDQVLVPCPSYPLFTHLAQLEQVEPVPYPLSYDGGWHIDLEATAAAITPRTRAIIAVSPNNPTGSYVKARERTRLLALCREHRLPLIVDEVFADYPLAVPADAVRTFADETESPVFVLNGLSKLCALPQMKVGWICVAGPPGWRRQALARLDFIADTFLSAATPSLLATPTWLRHRPALQAPLRERLAENLRILQGTLRVTSATPLAVEGGWYAVIRLPAVRSDEAWAEELLRRHHTLFHPGYWYDLTQHTVLVCTLLSPRQRFQQALVAVAAVTKIL